MIILIVDDSDSDRKLLRALLESVGETVFAASDGVEALAILEAQPIEVVISDILMPRMDGYRLCYEVRSRPRFRRLPFVFHTATYTAAHDARLSAALGADRFITKPAPANLLVRTLREVVREAASREPTTAPLPDGLELMKAYSERLVAKLEERNIELEAAREALHAANASLEQRIAVRTSDLAEANRQLEAFAYFASHELRAPLRTISGFSEILQREYAAELPSEAAEMIGHIVEGGHRMRRLTEDLLSYCRLGNRALDRCNVDLNTAVPAVLAELAPDREGREVKIEVGPLPVCRADPVLLHQVLLNLFSNALKFTRRRPVAVIEIGAEDEEEAEDGLVRVHVKDNGAGFDPGYADRLFGIFQRLHRQDEFEGTGLGLGIVRSIVERHGGRIWAESAVDAGATFFFTLPKGLPGE